jgi:hypothetical protein
MIWNSDAGFFFSGHVLFKSHSFQVIFLKKKKRKRKKKGKGKKGEKRMYIPRTFIAENTCSFCEGFTTTCILINDDFPSGIMYFCEKLECKKQMEEWMKDLFDLGGKFVMKSTFPKQVKIQRSNGQIEEWDVMCGKVGILHPESNKYIIGKPPHESLPDGSGSSQYETPLQTKQPLLIALYCSHQSSSKDVYVSKVLELNSITKEMFLDNIEMLSEDRKELIKKFI